MATITWCKKQVKGIHLIHPNQDLFQEYIHTAEETLDVLKSLKNTSNMWLATTKYYCEYFALYSLLMRIGIKCEIHDCTIAVCRLLEQENIIPLGYTKSLESDKALRIDNQYYLKNKEVNVNERRLAQFVLTLKNIGIAVTTDEINRIRQILA